jgi:hypothetical protein
LAHWRLSGGLTNNRFPPIAVDADRTQVTPGRGWPEDRTMDNLKQERRNEVRRRRRALKRARITFKGRCATIDCTVLNLSDLGACLKVESPIGIPDIFDLVLYNAPVRSCRVTWRSATQIGVAFA